ncbi:ThuA domain-containing protein [Lentisphaera marina]|uniref:ThuA domain-containing protein n=1 Tax=Lentisphaera marina TaxID=1111041 RepID=UPI0023665086|nr:ThuA domain-containing protein [Lentisphaera marina]MDD7985528.1 ThuA domain-containing protein [Lentisphaera marina]
MKFKRSLLIPFFLIFAIFANAQEKTTKKKVKKAPKPPKVLVPPSAEELGKVEDAIMAVKAQTPKQQRKILVYSQSHGFKHNSRLIGEEMLKLIEEKLKIFTVTINNNPEEWTDEYLKDFDAICILNATGLEHAFRKDENKKAFINFVENGGGLFGIHAATDGGKDKWPEYSEMWGGHFDCHPWGKTGTWKIDVCDHSNPINKCFQGENFAIKDELYLHKGPYKEGGFNTLTRIDVNEKVNTHNPSGSIKTVPGEKDSNGKRGPRVDLDLSREYPTSWNKKFGEGRIFYTTFGHNESTYWNPKIVEHYISGLQYTLGDLEADDTPKPLK